MKKIVKNHGLYKYNKRSGLWDHQRAVTSDTRDQWLHQFKKDEPDDHFVVSKDKPSHNPLKEEAPANSTGAGNIAGLGVGAKGEPGLNTKQRLSYKRKNQLDDKSREGQMATFIRRSAPMMEETPASAGRKSVAVDDKKLTGGTPADQGSIAAMVDDRTRTVKKGKFAGQDTFIVPSDMFHKARNEKSKGKHWKTYIGECEYGQAIREYANKNKKNSIVLEDENTGTMCYARYGKK
jgi:hypothetical protein